MRTFPFLNRIFFNGSPAILALVFLTSCIKEVNDPALPQAAPKLAVFSFISPQDTLLTVKVMQPTPFYGSAAKPGGFVTNATVLLSDGTKSVTLPHTTKGTYAIDVSELPILSGQTYVLTVTTPEGLRAKSSCTVPSRANDAITRAQVEEAEPETGNGKRNKYFLSVEWQDAPGEGDYYRIFAEAPILTYYKKASPDQPETVEKLYPPPIIFQQGEAFTQDTGQDGRKFLVTKGGFLTGFAGMSSTDGSYIELDRKVKVVLLTTDQAYYQYHQSRAQYERVDADNPFAEPVLVFSNVEGGLGVFSAYQRYTKQVSF